MRQMTGDILSVGAELFVHQPDIELKQFSSNRLDLKLKSVNLNDSGLYTCMFNDEKLISFLVEILGELFFFFLVSKLLIKLVATDHSCPLL
jgi:hypothetical protein